jgi:hypothetical protein
LPAGLAATIVHDRLEHSREVTLLNVDCSVTAKLSAEAADAVAALIERRGQ